MEAKVRTIMLSHAAIFREQLEELHRLYVNQEILMAMVGVNQQQQRQDNRKQLQISVNRDRLGSANQKDNPRLSIDNNAEDQQQYIAIAESESELDENGIDLTLSLAPPSCNPRRKNVISL